MQTYTDHFERAPVLVLPCLVRYREPSSFEGASIFPACQNLLLAARALGYGGVLTGFHFAVERELRALENAAGIQGELEVEGELGSLSDSQKIVLFRVVQEALSNVRKHSGAARVSVAIRSTRTFVDLAVTDDGHGFDPRRLAHDRLGLAGISERVRLLGGAVEIETSPGAGTTVRATLPQWRPSASATAAVYAAAP